MVTQIFSNKLVRVLEKFIIRKSNFRLIGNNYELILLVPNETSSFDRMFSLILSSKILDKLSVKEIVSNLLVDLQKELTINEYNLISRINIIDSSDSLVKNLKTIFSFNESVIYIKDIQVGMTNIESAYLLKSILLSDLIENGIKDVELINGDKKKIIIRRIDSSYNLICYSEKAIKEIWTHSDDIESSKKADFIKSQEEEYLFKESYLIKIPYDSIYRVIKTAANMR